MAPQGRREGEEPLSQAVALGGMWGQDGVALPQGNAGAGHGGHKSDPASGVAVPAGTSGGEAEEIPKGPWRQRGGCQEGVQGGADRHRGSLPGWHRHCGDTPPPSAPSATRWKEQSGREGKHGGDPLLRGILPQISLLGGVEPVLTPRAGIPPPWHPPTRHPSKEDGAWGAMPGGGGCGVGGAVGSGPGQGKPF